MHSRINWICLATLFLCCSLAHGQVGVLRFEVQTVAWDGARTTGQSTTTTPPAAWACALPASAVNRSLEPVVARFKEDPTASITLLTSLPTQPDEDTLRTLRMTVPVDGPNAPRSNTSDTVAVLQDTFDVAGLNMSAQPLEQFPVDISAAVLLNMSIQAADVSKGATATSSVFVDVEVPFSIVLRAWLCQADSPCASQPYEEVVPAPNARALGLLDIRPAVLAMLLDELDSKASVVNPGQVAIRGVLVLRGLPGSPTTAQWRLPSVNAPTSQRLGLPSPPTALFDVRVRPNEALPPAEAVPVVDVTVPADLMALALQSMPPAPAPRRAPAPAPKAQPGGPASAPTRGPLLAPKTPTVAPRAPAPKAGSLAPTPIPAPAQTPDLAEAPAEESAAPVPAAPVPARAPLVEAPAPVRAAVQPGLPSPFPLPPPTTFPATLVLSGQGLVPWSDAQSAAVQQQLTALLRSNVGAQASVRVASAQVAGATRRLLQAPANGSTVALQLDVTVPQGRSADAQATLQAAAANGALQSTLRDAGLSVDSLTLTTTPPPAPAPAAASNTTTTTTTTTSSSSSNVGLIVGIAVGVAAGVALVAGLGGWMLYRRRRSQRSQSTLTVKARSVQAPPSPPAPKTNVLPSRNPHAPSTKHVHAAPVLPTTPTNTPPHTPSYTPSYTPSHTPPPAHEAIDRVVVERSPLNTSPFAGSPFSSSAHQSSSGEGSPTHMHSPAAGALQGQSSGEGFRQDSMGEGLVQPERASYARSMTGSSGRRSTRSLGASRKSQALCDTK